MTDRRIIFCTLCTCLAGLVLAGGCTNLQINSEPSGADIYLNGNSVGQTNYETTVDPGTYTIVLQKNGYEPYQTRSMVSGDSLTIVDARLVPKESPMTQIYEKTITINRNCYAYYKYTLSPATKVTTQVIASGDMYGFYTSTQGFDGYLGIVNKGAQSSSGISMLNDNNWGSSFRITNFVPEEGNRETYYLVLDNTPISHYLTYSNTLPSAGGSVLVRISTDDPAFTILAESGGCMPAAAQ
jgi:hypothetical protein